MDISIEKQPVLINLALATANALECPECPQGLKAALSEVATELIDQLSGGNTVFELRALARYAEACPEAETPTVANPREE